MNPLPLEDGSPPKKKAQPAETENPRSRTETRFAWFIGLAALAVYVLTLCPSVYPGHSAVSVATVLNLLPTAPVTHPVWRFAAGAVARIPLFELPFRLNLFSALCGALATVTLFRLTSRVLFEFIHDDPLTYDRTYVNDGDAEPEKASSAEEPSSATDTSDYVSAMAGGLLTAFAFAFSAPFWSASASLHPQTFDLLLFLLMTGIFAHYIYTGSILSCVFAVFLCGMGLMEFVLFVVTAPVFLYLLFKAGNKHGQISESFVFLCLVSGLLGLGCGAAALISVSGAARAFDFHAIGPLFLGIAHAYQSDLTQGLPHMGWLLVLLETALPLIVVLWGAPKFFTSHEPLARWLWGLLNVLFTLVAIICLLGLPNTPWGLARQTFHTPVIPALATALTLGILFTYWVLVRTLPQLTYDSEDYYSPPTRPQRFLSLCMTGLIATVILLAPFRNLGDADGRKGAFADRIARALLAQTGDARRLVTDGVLGVHLLILNHVEHRNHTLVFVSPDYALAPPVRTRAVAGRAAGPQKGPPQQESPGLLIERWLRANPEDCDQVAVVSPPSLWTRAGLCAVPNGMVYLGSENILAVDGPQLLKNNEAFWRTLDPLLTQGPKRPPSLASLMSDVRRQASRVANDLGVFLEGRGCGNEADLAYKHALHIDQANLCASFNRYGLWLRNPALGGPAEQERLLLTASAQVDQGFLFERCSPLYGSLFSQPADLLDRHNVVATDPLVLQWIAYCRSQTSTGLQAPLPAAIPQEKENTLAQAVHALRAGNQAEAETHLRAFLSVNPEDLSGWAMLADLLFSKGKTDEIASVVLPAMRAAAGEKGHELVDMAEGLQALHQTPPRYRDARIFFLRALAHRPNHKDAQDQLLETDRLLGDSALLETDAAAILKTEAKHCAANAILGNIRLSQNRQDEAEKHLRQSIATLPSARALNALSEILLDKRKLEEAEKSARHALRLDPNFYQAWSTLGSVLAEQNRLRESEAAYRCALNLCANDPHLHLNLIRLNLRMNRIAEAHQILTLASPLVASASSSVAKEFDTLSDKLTAATSVKH